MTEVEILLHSALYEAVQENYNGWSCEINTHKYEDCVNVHLVVKGDKVLASVGKYRVGVNADDFYKLMIGGLE